MAKKIKLGTILPNDTFFYTIPFEQPGQTLTREILAEHFPVPKGKHGAPVVPGQDAKKQKAMPVPRVAPRTKASTKGR